jgi:hypothetical protein
LSEVNDKSKNKEKRIEEKEKVENEIQRSLAVARMKQAHKQIEDIEKSRKRSAITSLCNRIVFQSREIFGYVQTHFDIMKKNPDFYVASLEKEDENTILNMVKAYESIRYDMQKTIEATEVDFNKLFPEIKVELGTIGLTDNGLLDVFLQLMDMRIYCERSLQ